VVALVQLPTASTRILGGMQRTTAVLLIACGSTALSLARSYGHLDVAALLAEAGAD
jgi:hypothetical protein